MEYKLPENIRNFRIMRQLSQSKLAFLINKSTGTIANWEKGITEPPVGILIDLSKALDTTPNELLGWSESEELTAFKAKQTEIINEIEYLNRQKDDIDKKIRRYVSYMTAFNKTSDNKEN